MTRAVFFDVDFTLIRPGPMFRAEGYEAACARHGMSVDPARFDCAVAEAAPVLEDPGTQEYDPELFVAYTRRVIEGIGGTGAQVDACAREIYAEWAVCRHFELYEEVPQVMHALAASGFRIGLISNSHRCLASFESHFELHGLIAAAVSSSEYGLMKPHPDIFRAALRLAGVEAAAAVMVGDNLRQDVEGALAAGMRAVLLRRGALPAPDCGVPVIRSLAELPGLLAASCLSLPADSRPPAERHPD
ncbi:MAG: HAD family hydrolase [Acidobacteria bacterium]|nr:HAD family hydrolase [Acidobacteriota bacterium]